MTDKNGIEELYQGAVRVFASLIIIFGIVILVSTLVRGGGPFSAGVLLGLGFTALGVARLWLSLR